MKHRDLAQKMMQHLVIYVSTVLFRCSKGTSRFSAASTKLSSWEVEAAPVPHVEVVNRSDKLPGMPGRPPPVKQLVFKLAWNHLTYLTWWKMWMQIMIRSDLIEDLLRLWPLGTWKFGSFSTSKREMIWSFGDRSLSTICSVEIPEALASHGLAMSSPQFGVAHPRCSGSVWGILRPVVPVKH